MVKVTDFAFQAYLEFETYGMVKSLLSYNWNVGSIRYFAY